MARKPESLYESLRNRSRSSSRSDLGAVGGPNQRIIDDLLKQCYNLNKRVADLEKTVYDLQQKNIEITSKLVDCVSELHSVKDRKPIEKIDSLETILDTPKLSIWRRLKSNLINRPTIEALKYKRIYKNEPCFNTDLESVVRDLNSGIPKIVLLCCCLIEKILFECRFQDVNIDGDEDDTDDDDSLGGGGTEPAKIIGGIYRVPGDSVEIQKLRFKINDNKYEYLNRVKNVHTIASLVKLFFFELKTPLIKDLDILKSVEIYPEVFCKLEIDKKISVLKTFLENLPEIYYATLKFFILHLGRLTSDYSDLISAESLSVSIGPSIIHVERHHENIEDRCKYHELMNNYLFHIIKFSDYIFPRSIIRTTDV